MVADMVIDRTVITAKVSKTLELYSFLDMPHQTKQISTLNSCVNFLQCLMTIGQKTVSMMW